MQSPSNQTKQKANHYIRKRKLQDTQARNIIRKKAKSISKTITEYLENSNPIITIETNEPPTDEPQQSSSEVLNKQTVPESAEEETMLKALEKEELSDLYYESPDELVQYFDEDECEASPCKISLREYKNESIEWVFCVRCDTWYHQFCVEKMEGENYVCDICK